VSRRPRYQVAASGVVALAYSVPGDVGPAPRIRYVKTAKTRVKKGK
jgi:hypothetical protein